MAGERRTERRSGERSRDAWESSRSKENKGNMTVAEAGHLGGTRTSETHSHEFYEEIGHKGGEIGGQRVRELIQEGKKVEQQEGGAGSQTSWPESNKSRSRSNQQ
jgi:general stress protein YciG